MIWRQVDSIPDLEASDTGLIRRDGVLLNQYPRVRDYLGVYANRKLRFVHRLVAEAFHGPPPEFNSEAMHLDGDCRNNAADNLRWGSHAENMAMDRGNNHSFAGEFNTNRRLTQAIVDEIRKAYDGRKSCRWGRSRFSRDLGISEQQIYRIATRKPGGWT